MSRKKVISLLLAFTMTTGNPFAVAANEGDSFESPMIEVVESVETGTEVMESDLDWPAAAMQEASLEEKMKKDVLEETPDFDQEIQEEEPVKDDDIDLEAEPEEEPEADPDQSTYDETTAQTCEKVIDRTIAYEDKRDVEYVSMDTVLEIENGNGGSYQIVIAALPEEYQDDMIDFMNQYYSSASPEYKFTRKELVDAEKWSVYEAGVDSLHCWAATASNMLWNSGWASQAIDPLTGKVFESEDEVFTYFTYRMTDDGGVISYGLEWFFDAFYLIQNDEGAQLETADQSTSGFPFLDDTDGLFPNLCIDNILKYIPAVGDLSAISVIEDIIHSASIGMDVSFVDEGQESSMGHALTVVGMVMDTVADTVEKMYKSIILADSDNDGEYEANEDMDFADRMEDKSTRDNTYSIYDLAVYEYNGVNYWSVLNYWRDGITLITDFVVLQNYSDEIREAITETQGTCDLRNDVDLALEMFVSKEQFRAGEEIPISIQMVNKSYYDLTEDTVPVIPLSFTITKDGEFFGTHEENLVEYGVWNSTYVLPVEDNLRNIIGMDLPAGTYTIEVTVHPYIEGDDFTEAYYLNNTQVITFTILEEDPKPMPGPVKPLPKNDDIEEEAYVSIPVNLLHAIVVENDGIWDLSKEEDKDYFYAKIFHTIHEFNALYEVVEVENETSSTKEKEKLKVEEENYRVEEDDFGHCVIQFKKDYLNTLEEGKHTFEISIMGSPKTITFDVTLVKEPAQI